MRLQIFKDKNGKARLRLVGRNGEIIMSGEAYSSRAMATKTAMAIQDFVRLDVLIIEDIYASGKRSKTPGGVKK